MSWYEIGLYIDRYLHKVEQEQLKEEYAWARMRIGWADFRNAHRGDNPVVRPQDLIKLSFDKNEEQDKKPPSLKEAKKLLGSKFNLN